VTSCQPIKPGCGLEPVACVTCAIGSECLSDGTCCTPQSCPPGFTGTFNDGCGETLYCEPH
jgi:hypothetical protein